MEHSEVGCFYVLCVLADEAKSILRWADGKAIKSEVDMQVCNCLKERMCMCACLCVHVCVLWCVCVCV